MENNIKRKKLENAPIKEVILGIAIKGMFNSIEDINLFCENSSLLQNYTKRKAIKTVSFELSEDPTISQNITEGLELFNDDKSEIIQIEYDKIMFIDKTKYNDFKTFFNKFCHIINAIIERNDKPQIYDIGLRYLNEFELPIQYLDKYFKILPTITCTENDEKFAGIYNYLAISNISLLDNNNIKASIKTLFTARKNQKMNIIFDIDTHFDKHTSYQNIDILEKDLLLLKDFKNQIFFSNFVDAYSVKEFI